MKRIIEFDGLRTLAVVIVIADHYAPFRTMANGAPARLGGLGVDIFFVLSGFLITTILLGLKDTERPYQVFYARRLIRILPPFLLLLVLVYGLAVAFHEPIEKSKMFAQLLFLRSFKGTDVVLTRVFDVLRGALPVPGLFHRISGGPITADYPWLPITGSLGPTWSLSVEEWFYVLWAPVVLAFRRRTILAIALFVCVMGFVLRWLGGGGTDFFSTVDTLVAGGVLALWIERRKTLPHSTRKAGDITIAVVSALAFVFWVSLVWMQRDLLSRTLIAMFVFGGLSWIIHATGQQHPICSFLRYKPLVYLGSVSYMLYLIHLPMYFIVRSSLYGLTNSWGITAQYWTVALCSVAGTVGFSALSWKYFEQPILCLKDTFTHKIKEPPRAAELPAIRSQVPVRLPVDRTEQVNG